MSGALLALALFSPVGVLAEEPVAGERYRLQWTREDGAESCVSGAVLSRLLQQVLGAQPLPAGSSPILLQGTARPAPLPLRFSVRVTVRDAATNELFGERELTTSDQQCSALTPSLLLVLAMSVDPNAGSDGLPAAVSEALRGEHADSAPTPTPRAVTPPAVAAQSSNAPPVAAAPSDSKPTAAPSLNLNEPQVFGTLAASAGVLPSLAWGGGFGARLPLRRQWSLSFSLFGWKPQTVALPVSAFLEEEGVQLAAGQVGVALCRPLLGQRVQLGVCGGFGAGLRWVWARALANEDNPTRAFFGPELGLQGQWRFAPNWFLAANATTQVQLRHDRFTYRNHRGDAQVWFEPGALVTRLGLSLGGIL